MSPQIRGRNLEATQLPADRKPLWTRAGLLTAALLALAVWLAYLPSLRGEFVFDDVTLPFFSSQRAATPLVSWMSGVRPVLMASYWLNYQFSGANPWPYHATNLLLHLANGLLVFLIARRLLEWAGLPARVRSAFATGVAALFLLHPLQTESVAYVAGRSESLCALFLLSAYALHVWWMPEPVTPRLSFTILTLFTLACLSKEHAVVFPAVLLLTEFVWLPGGVRGALRRNWRLYGPLVALAALGCVFVLRLLSRAESAGFGLTGVPWHDYALTQARVLWLYVRLLLLPVNLRADYDLPLSRSPLEPGALFGLLALALLAAGAWHLRRRHPMALFSVAAFLLLLAPTSSVVPLSDTVAERRMYLPLLPLALAGAYALWRVPWPGATKAFAAGAALLALAGLTHQRSRVWVDQVTLSEDSARKSPTRARPFLQLAMAYSQRGQCLQADRNFAAAAKLEPLAPFDLVNWAVVLVCQQKSRDALVRLEQALAQGGESAQLHSLLGATYASFGRFDDAQRSLDRAVELNPSLADPYLYLGHLSAMRGDEGAAARHYRRATELDPASEPARKYSQEYRHHLRAP